MFRFSMPRLSLGTVSDSRTVFEFRFLLWEGLAPQHTARRADGCKIDAPLPPMRAWVYKVNSKRPGRFTGWHFQQFFRYRGRCAPSASASGGQPYDMGGRDWIRSPLSWQRLRRVHRGDLFVCYQADERKIYGLARAATAGYESLPGSGFFDSVDFEPRGLRLENPVSVQRPPACTVFRHLRAFTVPSRGTIHALAADELRALLRVLIILNPAQRQALAAFAQSARRPVR